ncbi:hypothetical protein JAB9_50500 [Janthinobacterium sp. HH107]|nr:hypothetical protein JAB8_41670 [Janthinobacterium sp. HH106]OEZ91333.1 hypothetical protein JAB9_50500 [Janthinobacterium sp. HH107]
MYPQASEARESDDTIHTKHYPDGDVVEYDHEDDALPPAPA